ncbi:lantibiotic dehydratase [Sphingobacterium sp.]|uniref:lantibiotic dehydratase n=1 Tax=Sphingobacterium sp. TaxID=341027 RepID=UPI00289F8AC1|nr:lantibiotic dehydratase [Sphingobacterium sp.]
MESFGKYVYRAPYFSIKDLQFNDLDELLAKKLNDPVFMEGIYWASPQFHHQAVLFKNNEILNKKKYNEVKTSLFKYLIRSSTRATPFGTFSGCGLNEFAAKQDDIDVLSRHSERKVRVDLNFLQLLINKAKEIDGFWKFQSYYVNSSLYLSNRSLRYIERIENGRKSQYKIAEVDRNRILSYLNREKSNNTKFTVFQLREIIGDSFSIADRDCYIKALIDNQILISELTLNTINNNIIKQFLACLHAVGSPTTEIVKLIKILQTTESCLLGFTSAKIGILPHEHLEVLKSLSEELGIVNNDQIYFHCDLHYATMSEKLTYKSFKEIRSAVQVSMKFNVKSFHQQKKLNLVKEIFRERYDQREIPLAEVFDKETGIEIEEKLVKSDFFCSSRFLSTKNINWLKEKYMDCIKSGSTNIEIKTEEIEEIACPAEELPATFVIVAMPLQNGKIVLQNIGGATANNLLGRFTYLDKSFKALAESIKQKEERGNYLLAEINFCPNNRTANITQRDSVYDYQIPYITNSTLGNTNTLYVSDLLVSLHQDQFFLRHKKKAGYILPRLSSAHNFNTVDLPIYNFLCSMQHQKVLSVQFDWSDDIKEQVYVPRVSYGSVIISRAMWNLPHLNYQKRRVISDPMDYVNWFISQWKINRYVFLKEGDMELFLDLKKSDFKMLLWEEWVKRERVCLVEVGIADDETLSELSQVIIPVYNQEKRNHTSDYVVQSTQKKKRFFLPGGEWLYYRVYVSEIRSNALLADINSLVKKMNKTGLIDCFFFIRYYDPHHHLRIRVKLASIQNLSEVMGQLGRVFNRWNRSKDIWKLEIGSYERELERYKVDIDIAEKIFFYDSMNILSYSKSFSLSSIQHLEYIQIGVGVVNHWFDLLGLEIKSRLLFSNKMKELFASEFAKEDRIYFSQLFREADTQFLEKTNKWLNGKYLQNLIADHKDLIIDNIADFIHMSLNRLFVSKQRYMEYGVYFFLYIIYQKTINKEKNN